MQGDGGDGGEVLQQLPRRTGPRTRGGYRPATILPNLPRGAAARAKLEAERRAAAGRAVGDGGDDGGGQAVESNVAQGRRGDS